jgi:hypothetical protein
MELKDIAAVVSALIAATALLLNWWQLRKNALQRRAEYIVSHFSRYLNDPDMARMFYKLEYSTFTYPEDFHGTGDEIHMDRLLDNYDRLATLYEMGALSFEDLESMDYELITITSNEPLNRYFCVLDAIYEQRNIQKGSFPSLRKVGRLIMQKRNIPVPEGL